MASRLSPPNVLLDTEWSRQSFFRAPRVSQTRAINFPVGGTVGANYRDKFHDKFRFSDTTLGGGPAINMPYGNTTLADPMPTGLHGHQLTGDYYYDAIEKNGIYASFQFGVPKFNSLSKFLFNAHDQDMAFVVNNGEFINGLATSAGYALTVLYTLPLQVVYGVDRIIDRVKGVVAGTPYSKFYYMEPRMSLYWASVSMMVNMATTSLKIRATPVIPEGVNAEQPVTSTTYDKASEPSADSFPSGGNMPDIFNSQGFIDMYKVASRYQLRALALHSTFLSIDKATYSSRADYTKALYDKLQEVSNGNVKLQDTAINKRTGGDMVSYLDEFVKIFRVARPPEAQVPIGKEENTNLTEAELKKNAQAEAAANKSAVEAASNIKAGNLRNKSFWDFLAADVTDGTAFVTFKVDGIPTQGENFSVQTGTIGLEDMLNSASDSAEATKRTFANGNLGDGVIASAAESVVSAVDAFIGGTLEALGFSAYGVLTGSAKINLPNVITSTQSSLPATNLSITLRCPNPTPEAYLQDILIPMFCIIAGGVARSTGRQSYQHPWLCRFHCKGMNEIREGVISNITITRGEGNVAWSANRYPTEVRMDVEVTNLNEVLHVPIEQTLFKSTLGFGFFDEDTALSDYIDALTARTLPDSYYAMARLGKAWERTKYAWNEVLSPARIAMETSATMPGRWLNAIAINGQIGF